MRKAGSALLGLGLLMALLSLSGCSDSKQELANEVDLGAKPNGPPPQVGVGGGGPNPGAPVATQVQ